MASSTMMISIMTLMVVMMASTAVAQGNAYNWTTIRSNIGQICPGLDFYSPTSGYILDFVSGPGPILLHTSDGGATLTSALSGIDILIMENIVTANAGQQAVTGGVSLLEPISIQTNDGGSTWIKSTTVVLQSKFNGLQVLGNGDIVFFGSWSVRNSGEKGSTNYAGFAYSANQGNSYSYVNWPYPTITPVAGNFIGTSNTVVLIGSAAPYVASDNTAGYAQLLNHHKKGVPVFESDFPANETYRSYVAISTNSGATWNTIYSYEGVDNVTGISLGGGFFLTATTGFISGMNHTVAGSAAFLLGTTDGGATWVQLLQVPGGIFSRVECISANECFVIGGAPGGVLGNGVVYQTTNAGKTWTQTLIPKIAALTDISVVNSNTIYATAVTAFQTCDLLYWGPAQSASTSE